MRRSPEPLLPGRLLSGWSVVTSGHPAGPAARAGSLLGGLGAAATGSDGGAETLRLDGGAETLRLRAEDGREHLVVLPGWRGEAAVRRQAGVTAATVRAGDRRGPGWPVATTYLALRVAGAALRGIGSGGPASLLEPAGTAAGLVAGLPEQPPSDVETLRCGDGWVVARWRDGDDRRLLHAVLRQGGGRIADLPVDHVTRVARECRLLVGAVRPGPARPPAVRLQSPLRAAGARPGRRGPRTIVDWTPLWAGPWLCQQLAHGGERVVRVERPGGPGAAARFGQGKQSRTLDARTPHGRTALAALLRDADVLVYAYTPRALAQLGFTKRWFETRAPQLLRLSLTAFDPPDDGAPGLGEQAAAAAGLLWAGGRRPLAALPWADPLLGAWGLLVLQACLLTGVSGGHLQLSLEGAAALASPHIPAADGTRPAAADTGKRVVL